MSKEALSEGNVEIVRRVYQQWARGEMGAGVELFDPEISFESYMPDANERLTATGPREVEAFMRDFLGQWLDFKLIGDEFRVVGDDTVLVRGRQAALGRQSGVEVEMEMHSIWTWREGRVVRLIFEPDMGKAEVAAGLS